MFFFSRMKATSPIGGADGKYLGYLNSHPGSLTQGEDLDDLKEHLADLY